MKFKKIAPLIISVLIMISLITISTTIKKGVPNPFNQKNINDKNIKQASTTADTADNIENMRGIWITYMDLSMAYDEDKSEKAFTEKFEIIANKCKDFGFNTLIVQVRPFSDALYKSDIFPYSHILTGTQGENPNYDPLKIICNICKSKKLKVHAWINPYRVSVNNTPEELSENNPYIKDKSIGIETENGIFLDPSNEKARQLITNGVLEIVKNYDVDGIQFDDYFYPTQSTDFDSEQYEKYISNRSSQNYMSLENWRKSNVNMLICDVYRAVHAENEEVVFGISPQGNINNNKELYADVKLWCSCRGFVDYICPQIYFSLENPALTFSNSLKSWTDIDFAENVKLYIGLAGYKAGSDKDEGTWLNNDNILAKEYEIINNNNAIKGFMLYAYASLNEESAKNELENLKNALN